MSPFFPLPLSLQMKSHWKGLSLTESCVFILSITGTCQTLLPCLFPLNIPKSPAIPVALHGWNDHPGNRCFVGKVGEDDKGRVEKSKEREREREVSHVIAGFHLSSQQSHNRNVLQHLVNKDNSGSLTRRSEGPKSKHFFPRFTANFAHIDIIRLFARGLNRSGFNFRRRTGIMNHESD